MTLVVVGALLQAATNHQQVGTTHVKGHLWTLEAPLAAIPTILLCKGSKLLQKVVKNLHKNTLFSMTLRLMLCPWRIPMGR